MTLDQLSALEAIVATGTFRSAAGRLNKAQSAVSHQIRKLEDELCFDLFTRDTYRPQLTPEGEVFHREALRVLQQFRTLKRTSEGLVGEFEAVVRVAVAATISLEPFLGLLADIGQRFPSTHIQVASEMMGGPLARLMQGEADLIIAGLEGVPTDQVDTVPVGSVVIQPVAHRRFPVAQMPGIRTRAEMQGYTQVVVAGTGGREYEQSRDVLQSGQRWTVSDFATKKSVIMAGLGWGGMPSHLIAEEVRNGDLIPLNVEGFAPRHTEVFAIRRRDQTMGRVVSNIWTELEAMSAESSAQRRS